MAKELHFILVNCLREACRGTVVSITDHPNITPAVYHGHKATNQKKKKHEPRHEKTNVLVSDQVPHKQAVQLQKMARGLKFWI